MSVKISTSEYKTYYHYKEDEKDPFFMDAIVMFENHKWFGIGWNLYVRKTIDSRGLLSWNLISKSQDRKMVEEEALKFMATGKIKTEWCRGSAPNF